jgi:RNA polymerase sigma-70 factor (ECF subfamily)
MFNESSQRHETVQLRPELALALAGGIDLEGQIIPSRVVAKTTPMGTLLRHKQFVGVKEGERATNEDATNTVSALYESWYSSLVRYGARATGSVNLAEDLVQECFMKLYLCLRAGKRITHPKAWTLRVLRHKIWKQWRAEQDAGVRYVSFDEVEPALMVRPDSGREIGLEDVTALLSLLTHREEEVLLLRMEAMKYREIATQLGISTTSVNTLLARALRKLQRAVENDLDKPSSEINAQKNCSKTLQ